MNEETSSAARGMFLLSIAGILTKVISVFYTPFLRSILGISGYGIYSRTTEVFLFIYSLSCMGAQPAVAKVVAEYTALENPRGANRVLKVASKLYIAIGAVLGMIMILLAEPISRLIEVPEVSTGIKFLAPCVLITSVLAVLRGYMQGKNDMTPIGISQVIEQIINVVISLLGAYILVQSSLEMGSAGAQIGTSVGALVACFFIIYCYDKRPYREEAMSAPAAKKKVNNKRILNKLIMYSVPITISAGLQNFGGLVDMFNVSTRLHAAGFDGEKANYLYGLLGTYKTIYGVPLVVITAIGTTVLPSLAKSLVLKERKKLKKDVTNAFRMALLIAIPSAVGLSMLASEIYYALFNTDAGCALMVYGSFVMVLMSVTQIQSTVLQGINKLYYILGTFAVGIVAKIIINFILVGIPEVNVYGVIVGNAVWHLIPGILNHKKICSTLKMRMNFIRLMFKPLISAALMAVAIYIFKMPVGLLYKVIAPSRIIAAPICVIGVLIGAFVYGYAMILMGGISRADIDRISPKIMRFLPKFMRRKLK